MSNLQTQIRDDMKTAMKAHDKQRTGTLRMFLAALTAEETSGARHKLDDDEVLKVLAREIKKRKESFLEKALIKWLLSIKNCKNRKLPFTFHPYAVAVRNGLW